MGNKWNAENWTPEAEGAHQAYHRLVADGRWEAFSARKKQHSAERKKLVGVMNLSKEAKDAVYLEVLGEFPPLVDGEPIVPPVPATHPAPEPPPPTEADFEELAERSGSADFDQDFEWAWKHIRREKIHPSEAPSGAAMFLWEYGQSARAEFAKMGLAYFTKKRQTPESERAFQDDMRRQFRLLELFAGER